MSGFTDAFYKEMTDFYKDPNENRILSSKKPYYDVSEAMTPSYWFEPLQVVHPLPTHLTRSSGLGNQRCEFNSIPCTSRSILVLTTVSLTSVIAGVGVDSKRPHCGISVRFPRFIRVRPDKPIQSATSVQQAC